MAEDERHYEALPPALADAASWHLATQLVRRHPEELWITTPIPFSGLYDLLEVHGLQTPGDHPALSFNRNGANLSVSRFGSGGGADSELLQWQEALYLEDPRDWIVKVERAAGLRSPSGGLPASTASSLALRWVSQFLWTHLASLRRWTAWTEDRVDIEAGDNPFSRFPQALRWVHSQGGGSARFLVQFVGPADRRAPQFALTAAGDLWDADGPRHHLPSLHQSGGSVTQLVTQTAGSVLP